MGFQVFAGRNRPATSPGKSGVRRRAETRLREHAPHGGRRQRERDLRRADVRRLLDHLLDRQRAVGMRVVNRVGADREGARRRLDHRVRPHRAALERRCDGERLQRRAGLEDIGERAVAHLLARDLVARIRVVGRPVGQRQDLAGLRVEDHEAAGLGAVRLDRRLQFAEREILEARVDRRAQDRGPPAAHVSTRRPRRLSPRRLMITRRLPGLPPSHSCCASSMPSWPTS